MLDHANTPAMKTSVRSSRSKRLWDVHTGKILLSSGLVILPMTAFTVALIIVVFLNRVDLDHCPYPELCPYINQRGPSNSSAYYVDVSVGRLAFVASLSSTVSFALIASLMTMYGYVVAKQLMQASKEDNSGDLLPTPQKLSHLIRMLNAEVVLLYEIIFQRDGRQSPPRMGANRKKKNEAPQMFRTCRRVLLLCLVASILIQIADTYLHVVTNAISVRRLLPESGDLYKRSNVLAPWYFRDDGTYGTKYSKLFWSNALRFRAGEAIATANTSAYWQALREIGPYIANFTNNDISYAIVRPTIDDPDIDWSGSGYGVSTQCTAIPRLYCNITDVETAQPAFNCTATHLPLGDENGYFSTFVMETWTYDWHQYLTEGQPFTNKADNDGLGYKSQYDLNNSFPLNITFDSSNAIFRNPWQWLAKVEVASQSDDTELPIAFLNSSSLIRAARRSPALLLTCNTTVHDIKYTVINNKIILLETVPSNGSVAGMVSMMSLNSLDFITVGFNQVVFETNQDITTPEAFIKKFEFSMSKVLSAPLVVHTVPHAATTVQRRSAQVITELPKVALWLLITANLLFLILGITLTTLALKAASEEVHQARLRLSVAGLAAQLLDPQHGQHASKNDSKLFDESLKTGNTGDLVTVGVQRTSLGGAGFYTMIADKEQDSEPSEETAALQHDVESQQTMSLPNGTFRPIPDNTPSCSSVNTVRDSPRATLETLPNDGFNPPEALPSR